jgi:hypothetical protein
VLKQNEFSAGDVVLVGVVPHGRSARAVIARRDGLVLCYSDLSTSAGDKLFGCIAARGLGTRLTLVPTAGGDYELVSGSLADARAGPYSG